MIVPLQSGKMCTVVEFTKMATFQIILAVIICSCLHVDKLEGCFCERYLKISIQFVVHCKFEISNHMVECSLLKGNFCNIARYFQGSSCNKRDESKDPKKLNTRCLVHTVNFSSGFTNGLCTAVYISHSYSISQL
jgi:hypothetical protein